MDNTVSRPQWSVVVDNARSRGAGAIDNVTLGDMVAIDHLRPLGAMSRGAGGSPNAPRGLARDVPWAKRDCR